MSRFALQPPWDWRRSGAASRTPPQPRSCRGGCRMPVLCWARCSPAGSHPAAGMLPGVKWKAALSIERGCEHSQWGGEGPELLLRPADVRSLLPLRHPCNIHAMPLQCSCSTLGVPALVAARSWVQLQGQNNISHTWCLCGKLSYEIRCYELYIKGVIRLTELFLCVCKARYLSNNSWVLSCSKGAPHSLLVRL